MHFQIELFAELSLATITLIFFYAGMGFQVFVQVAHLTERWVAVLISAFVRLLFSMDPKMSEKLTHALYNSMTFSFSCFRISMIALKQPVLLFEIVILLNVVEYVIGAIGYMISISEHTWVEVFSLDNWNLVTGFDFITFHKLGRKNILAEFKLQLVHTVHIHFLAAVELLLQLTVVLLISPNLERPINFGIDFFDNLFFFFTFFFCWGIDYNH